MEAKKYCTIRKDLQGYEWLIPVGHTYIASLMCDTLIEYRWVNDDEFQVFFNGEWLTAESLDFDFPEI